MRPFERISPSRFAALRECPLREAWAAGSEIVLLPRSPMTVMGLVAHQVLREAARSADSTFHPERRWDELIEAMNEKLRQSWVEVGLCPIQLTAPMYEVLKRRTCVRATKILSTTTGGGKTTRTGRRSTGYEVWVESRDGKVAGSIDKAEIVDGEIVLSDLKTGSVTNTSGKSGESDVKESYAVQLKMYAALYEQTFGRWPARLRIDPLSGASKDLEFTQSECSGLISSASIALETLNTKIGDASQEVFDLASPSAETCRFCTFRPTCKAYRTESSKGHRKWPPDVFGKIWDINILQNGRMNLRISTDGGEHVTLRALSSQQHPALENIQRGHQVGMFNARPSADKLEYSVGPMTILYKYEDSFFAGGKG